MTNITVAKGDGIGPEIMKATLDIILAAGADIAIDEIEVGEKVYLKGISAGITDESWDLICRNQVFLKGPITTPQGGGYKSLNVSARKFLGLFANIRPCVSLAPFIQTKHPQMDLVIVRENEEDLYAGIEHQQTDEVVQCLKLISRPGCEKIIRYAFEYAKQHARRKVTCFTKDNIMKQTDGLFHRVFNEIAGEYPGIEHDHLIIDIGAARLADTPEAFDIIVTPNLYGDILSDVAAQISGSIGMAGSANIGEECAMFEAIHGSAPQIAGRQIANPSGLLQGAIMMLNHIGQSAVAEKVQNAWLKTIEEGIHTPDIYRESTSLQMVGTQAFAQAVIENLDCRPARLQPVSYANHAPLTLPKYVRKPATKKSLVGVDLFVHWRGTVAFDLAKMVTRLNTNEVQLSLITNRGIKVYPDGFNETFCTDHWRCRFMKQDGISRIAHHDIVALLIMAIDLQIDVIKTENLYTFDDIPAYSLAQGQ